MEGGHGLPTKGRKAGGARPAGLDLTLVGDSKELTG
jgi:hypothetical protein